MIKILLVDDHVLIRKGIALLLGNYSDMTVVGEASDGEEAIQLAYQTEPNVILMDISIPNGLDGFTATKEIKKNLPDTKIIMLTMHNEIAYIQQAMEVGADGYILKNSQGGEMYEAIQSVYTGRRYYEVGLPKGQLEKLFKKKGKNNADILSTREQEIVRLTILGFTNMQISEKLFISAKTVENHKANIMQKLNLKSKAELIQYGITNKYIT
ncbi:response regulator transcription factor [Lysinibacillus sphaericus]|uniref:DNA-binding response regulator n=5 Tax=Lysinibacillus TaxID=400634 RepID=A0A2S0K1I6_LYSSH|nr:MULTISPECIES: response regulator transcription factor [Lysinibacillus]AHN21605.1 chemotaxis protein CheY [Lysinibacillus varians]AVK97263.1 DNA-binding response regulator [Lysinibacillus sphaericus]MCS1382191.1 response regulator transcription factor [Lysinibacillus sphaericus]MED4542566.1 response regulator transcription factor [Lysinibacillus sphaericus]TKI20048.1 response regulator transcription factor [Lysinibacillus sphaericus]